MPPEPESDDPEIVAFLAQPGMRERMEDLAQKFQSNLITLRTIGDFSQEQMDAGYAVCYRLLEQRDYLKCMEMCGWMLQIDGHDDRFYQLAGLCAHNLHLFCLADFCFESVAIWREGGADAATLIYHGEAHILQDEREDGLKLVEQGLALAQGQRGYEEIIKRGRMLLKQYAPAAHSAASPA